MEILTTNWTNIAARLTMLLCALALPVVLFFYFEGKAPVLTRGIGSMNPIYLVYALSFILVYLSWLLLTSFMAVSSVIIDIVERKIVFCRFTKKEAVAISQIKGFSPTLKDNGLKKFKGLLIYLDDGRKLQVAGKNVLNLERLQAFLEQTKRENFGETRAAFPFN